MEALQVLGPLLGVVLGSLLSGVAAHLRARQERRRLISLALADLLEVRHRLIGFNAVVAKISGLAGAKPEMMPAVRNLFESMFPADADLDQRYTQAVNLLAGIDPLLAFSLRSKQALPKFLSTFRAHATAGGTDLGMFEQVESKLVAVAMPTLDEAVLELARSHSFFTARKVRRIVKRSSEMPVEVNQYFDQFKTVLGSAVTSEETGRAV